MISDVQTFTTLSNSMTDLPVENCSRDLYRDNFDIRINHFNTSDSGYYWCQMSINNTYVQPSDHAFFCASTNCHDSDFQRLPYFRLAIQGEHTCARYLKVSSESPSMEVVSTRSLASLSATTLGNSEAVCMLSLSKIVP